MMRSAARAFAAVGGWRSGEPTLAAALDSSSSSATLSRAIAHALNNPWVSLSLAQRQQQQQQPCAGFTSSSTPKHGHSSDDEGSGETITVTFVCEKDGSEHTVQAPIGKSLLEVAHANDVELEGACEGSLACSTCHVILEDEALYHKLPEATEDELDMLDLAFGLTDTSRLGCQVIASKELDGMRVRLPSATRNFYVSEEAQQQQQQQGGGGGQAGKEGQAGAAAAGSASSSSSGSAADSGQGAAKAKSDAARLKAASAAAALLRGGGGGGSDSSNK